MQMHSQHHLIHDILGEGLVEGHGAKYEITSII